MRKAIQRATEGIDWGLARQWEPEAKLITIPNSGLFRTPQHELQSHWETSKLQTRPKHQAVGQLRSQLRFMR
eukprot:4766520-Amphidinium_carterae.1